MDRAGLVGQSIPSSRPWDKLPITRSDRQEACGQHGTSASHSCPLTGDVATTLGWNVCGITSSRRPSTSTGDQRLTAATAFGPRRLERDRRGVEPSTPSPAPVAWRKPPAHVLQFHGANECASHGPGPQKCCRQPIVDVDAASAPSNGPIALTWAAPVQRRSSMPAHDVGAVAILTSARRQHRSLSRRTYLQFTRSLLCPSERWV